MLDYVQHIPSTATDGAPLFVLLHGRGSDMHDLLGLADGLPADALLISPQAPFPGSPWGYGPGWAWYRYAGEDRVVSDTLTQSLEALDDFLGRILRELPVSPGRIVLGGFSQGGTTSVAYGLTRPGAVDRILNFSGFVADDPAVPVDPEAAAQLSVFWGHGVDDTAIPHAFAVKGRGILSRAGASVEARDYPIGHWIAPEEFADAMRWALET